MKSTPSQRYHLWKFCIVCFLTPVASIAQVTYFSTPPTLEELQQALRGGPSTRSLSSTSQISRGIRFNDLGEQRQQGMVGDTRDKSLISSEGHGIAEATPAVAVPLNFNSGKSQVTKTSLRYIEVIAEIMNKDPSLKFIIEGHSDSSGDPKGNLLLSWERALSVYKLLITRYGIDPNRLRPLGKGSTEPIQGIDPTANIHRRVQFRVMG